MPHVQVSVEFQKGTPLYSTTLAIQKGTLVHSEVKCVSPSPFLFYIHGGIPQPHLHGVHHGGRGGWMCVGMGITEVIEVIEVQKSFS